MQEGEWGRGREAFMAHEEAIRQELAAGTPVRRVWRNFAERVPISYSNFARYVGLLCSDVAVTPGKRRVKPPADLPAAGEAAPPLPPTPLETAIAEKKARGGDRDSGKGPIIAGPDPRKTFVHNPVPNPDDLI